MEVIYSIEETVPGSALDGQLRREHTQAILEFVASWIEHRSQVQSVPLLPARKSPAISRAFSPVNSGGRI
jgi:hypothetical protein